jgi:ParB-like chromosome segregation protein Spo0J
VDFDIDELVMGKGVRLGGLRADHVRMLAELEGRWPPLVVTREEHVIVDGNHRFHAARSLGLKRVACVLFDGDSADAFVEAVRLNVQHGLPLSMKERSAAARRMLMTAPDRSDRWIGEACGLAHGTVASLRKACSSGQIDQLDRRRGKDGRRRPVNAAAVRQTITEAITANPDASLRAIAGAAGTAASTVRSVKAWLEHDAETHLNRSTLVTRKDSKLLSAVESLEEGQKPTSNSERVVDQAMLTSEGGEAFAEWFEMTAISDDWETFVLIPPISRVYELSDEARRRAQRWAAFADALERRVRGLATAGSSS